MADSVLPSGDGSGALPGDTDSSEPMLPGTDPPENLPGPAADAQPGGDPRPSADPAPPA